MRFTRKLAWTVTPLVALSLGVGGFAAAAWHTGVSDVRATNNMASLKPVTMTATLAGPIWPGQPLKLVAHFNNPNPVAVTINSIEADHMTYVVAGHWVDGVDGQPGFQSADTTTVMGANSNFPLVYPIAHMYDLSANFIAPKGESDRNITGPTLDIPFGTSLAQGSQIAFSYNVSESF